MKLLWGITGALAVVLAIIGFFLPFLPTVPFLLIAAFCFARSHESLHFWLLNHKIFGPLITNWRENGAISRRAKLLAGVSMFAAFGISLSLGVPPIVLGAQGVTLIAVALFIWSRPEA